MTEPTENLLTWDDMEGVQDYQDEPWFCVKHQFQAIKQEKADHHGYDYSCPKCLALIDQAWEEATEGGNSELAWGFPLMTNDTTLLK